MCSATQHVRFVPIADIGQLSRLFGHRESERSEKGREKNRRKNPSKNLLTYSRGKSEATPPGKAPPSPV